MVQPYSARMRARTEELRQQGKAVILAIESSCDETSVALVRDGRQVLALQTASQIDTHKDYGGVVPEIASRMHVEAISWLVDAAFRDASMAWQDVDAIAVTYGPGLVGALLVGVSFAKACAFAQDKPLVGVHHIEGHISANYITYPDLTPPYLGLVVSGGHTMLVRVEDYGRYTLLGSTMDDAAGEAFDKGARILGLPYPGGRLIDELAATGNPEAFAFPRAKVHGGPLDFSFSGLKTALMQLAHRQGEAWVEAHRADLAASYQAAIVDALVGRTCQAAEDTAAPVVVISGGVAANKGLRRALEAALGQRGVRLLAPSLGLCTDNAAMIGAAGYFQLMQGRIAGLDLNAVPYLPLGLVENV